MIGPYVVYITWDQDHQSPPIGPFATHAEARSFETEIRKELRLKVMNRVRSCYLADPDQGASMGDEQMIPDFKLIFTVSTDPRSDLGVDGEPAPPAALVPRESEGGRTSPSGAFVKAFRAEMEAADVAYKEELRRDARLWSALTLQASPGRTDAPSPGEDPHDPPSCGDEPATPDASSPPFRGASGRPAGYWTTDSEGRSNSSPEFLRLVGEVERLIRGDAHILMCGGADSTARLIVAQLAHVHGLQLPEGTTTT